MLLQGSALRLVHTSMHQIFTSTNITTDLTDFLYFDSKNAHNKQLNQEAGSHTCCVKLFKFPFKSGNSRIDYGNVCMTKSDFRAKQTI